MVPQEGLGSITFSNGGAFSAEQQKISTIEVSKLRPQRSTNLRTGRDFMVDQQSET